MAINKRQFPYIKQIQLTGDRVPDYRKLRLLLAEKEGTSYGLTAQKVMACAIQTALEHVEAGGELTFEWTTRA